MSRFWSAILIALLGAGFYLHFFSIDPLSLVIIGMLLWNNVVAMNRQQQLADLISKSHNVSAENQKAVLTGIQAVRSELRKK